MNNPPIVCEPRYSTPRTPSRETIGHDIALTAKRLGYSLLPWQELVADVGGELLDDGTPAYREVLFTVPRQSGKSLLLLAWMVQRALGWGGQQSIIYSAQTGLAARQKLLHDFYPDVLDALPEELKVLPKGALGLSMSAGDESITFNNRSRLLLIGKGRVAGHGKTVDLAVADEYFADTDDYRRQALIPAMVTRPAAQLLITSTAGDETSVPLLMAVERGRELAKAGDTTSGVAFFEWSAEPEADADDPATWRSCMPALGFTQTERAITTARASMEENEFRRSFLNVPTASDSKAIPPHAWRAVQATDLELDTSALTAAIDINYERTHYAIGAADVDRNVGLLASGPLSELVPTAAELAKRYGIRAFVVDGASQAPISGVLDALERGGIKLNVLRAGEYVPACTAFYDAVVGGTIKVRNSELLDLAVADAKRGLIGDSWRWQRRNTQGFIAPLVAITLALKIPATKRQKARIY